MTINAVSVDQNEFDGTYLSEGFGSGVFLLPGWDMVSLMNMGTKLLRAGQLVMDLAMDLGFQTQEICCIL